MKLSVSSAFSYFESHTHIFPTNPFWFSNKVLEDVYYYNFTKLFWANTVISDSFEKVYLLHYHPIFPNFLKCYFY